MQWVSAMAVVSWQSLHPMSTHSAAIIITTNPELGAQTLQSSQVLRGAHTPPCPIVMKAATLGS